MQMLIPKRIHDLDGFKVNRILPYHRKRMVGPFIFWDHMGPMEIQKGDELTVRSHPHIGISTLTYLFEGKILHRDTLGFEQVIEAGQVNWMTAGRGIAHSERIKPLGLKKGTILNGIQAWIALPKEKEEIAPSFEHIPHVPEFELDGIQFTLIAGSLLAHKSTVPVYSDLFYLDARMPKGSRFRMPLNGAEAAVYVVKGKLQCAEELEMFVFENEFLEIEALHESRVMILGGAPFPEKRHIWWNFVSSSKERIERAKEDWKTGKFGSVIHETEEIPLPE